MSDTPFRTLASDADWSEAQSLSDDQPVLLFKHSNACPVSGNALKEMRQLAEGSDLPVYKLVVQENRALSNAIEAALGVRHETPQAILLDEQAPAFHTSHFDVTAETLREAAPSDAVTPE